MKSITRAFTLIELLVVIAIIAILAAILFPVFAQAKLAAKKTTALSNCKQIATGILIYCNDVDDEFPIGSGNNWYYPTAGGWAWDTQPYIKSYPLLLDTSDPKLHTYWQTWFNPQTTVPISFVGNGQIKWNGSANEASGVINMLQTWFDGTVVPSTSVTRPADTILLADAWGHDNIFGGGDIVSNITSWDYTGPQAIPDATRNGQPYTVTIGSTTNTVNADNRNGAIATVYNNNGIFTFTDSHAKSMNCAATNPNMQNLDADDTKDLWNAKKGG